MIEYLNVLFKKLIYKLTFSFLNFDIGLNETAVDSVGVGSSGVGTGNCGLLGVPEYC